MPKTIVAILALAALALPAAAQGMTISEGRHAIRHHEMREGGRVLRCWYASRGVDCTVRFKENGWNVDVTDMARRSHGQIDVRTLGLVSG